jgi:hypothetical protein
MDPITSLVRVVMHYRVRAIRRYATDFESIQRKTLMQLIRQASDTCWGKEYGYDSIQDYKDYAKRVPVSKYSSIKPYVMRMLDGEPNVLWPGQIRYFAQSSGTTCDAAKFIPVSRQGLKHCHLMGGKDVTATFLDTHPHSHAGLGYSLVLAGVCAPVKPGSRIMVGDISSIMSRAIPGFFRRMLHLIPPARMLRRIHEYKDRERIVPPYIARKRLVSFSGLPGWNLPLLQKTVQMEGKENAEQLWPHMEMFAHGGYSLYPYRPILNELFPSCRLVCIENYNASEGFFGIQTDSNDPSMMLMLDYQVFYEFIPMTEYGRADARVLPLWEVDTDQDYAVVITTSSGLWRYEIGDVIRFVRKAPYKFIFAGRTALTLNICGEDLSIRQADQAIGQACRSTGCIVREYTVAPNSDTYDENSFHLWLVEFEKEPDNISEFASVLQKCMEQADYDYSKMTESNSLKPLQVIVARPGLFYDWLESKGKLGGQHKVPRFMTHDSQVQLFHLNLKNSN